MLTGYTRTDTRGFFLGFSPNRDEADAVIRFLENTYRDNAGYQFFMVRRPHPKNKHPHPDPSRDVYHMMCSIDPDRAGIHGAAMHAILAYIKTSVQVIVRFMWFQNSENVDERPDFDEDEPMRAEA